MCVTIFFHLNPSLEEERNRGGYFPFVKDICSAWKLNIYVDIH